MGDTEAALPVHCRLLLPCSHAPCSLTGSSGAAHRAKHLQDGALANETRMSADPSPRLLLAGGGARNAASHPLLSAPTDLLGSAPGVQTWNVLSNRAVVQEDA